MKKLSLLLLPFVALFFFACKGDAPTTETTTTGPAAPVLLGKKIENPAPITADQLRAKLDDTTTAYSDITIDGGNVVSGVPVVVEGKIVEVCQTSGCWLTLQTTDGVDITLLVKDKQFKLPADATGKSVIAQGGAYKSVTTVEERRQIAKANGTPTEKIAEINSPSVEYFFSAEGAIIK